jgi:hypothetical protein
MEMYTGGRSTNGSAACIDKTIKTSKVRSIPQNLLTEISSELPDPDGTEEELPSGS